MGETDDRLERWRQAVAIAREWMREARRLEARGEGAEAAAMRRAAQDQLERAERMREEALGGA